MREINQFAHGPFLHSRLVSLLSPRTYAGLAWRQIGAVIESLFEEEDGLARTVYMSSKYPADRLADWVKREHWFDLEWLRSEDGKFYCDYGQEIDPAVPITVSEIQYLATYALWLVEEDAHCCGPTDEHDWAAEPYNSYGWTEARVANHRGECMLVAYQLLWYIEDLHRKTDSSDTRPPELIVVDKVDFAALGKAGAEKRHAKTKALEAYARSLYVADDWDSPNAAAFAFATQVREYGRTIGAHLTPQNAQRTIAGWLRKSV